MHSYERSYGTARFVFGFLEIAGWLAVAAGLIVILLAALAASQLNQYYPGGGAMVVALTFGPGAGITIAGIFAVAQAQSGRAHVETAEMTRELLDLAGDAAMQPRQPRLPEPNASAPASVPPDQTTRPAMRPADISRVEPAMASTATVVAEAGREDDDPQAEEEEDDVIWPKELYRGVEMTIQGNGVFAGGQRFDDVDDAKAAINAAYERRQRQQS